MLRSVSAPLRRLLPSVEPRLTSCVGRAAGRGGAAAMSTSAGASSTSIAKQRLRSPVTWISASATLGALYGLYQFQYTRQLTAERMAGKPDLGGDFSLLDWDGKRVSNKDFLGKWVLLYYGFTKCPDICPEELQKVSSVLARLEAEGISIQPIFITIDPARDTQQRLKHYFKEAGMDFDPRFIALTGEDAEVKKACRAYRVYFTKPSPEEIKRGDYLLDHSIISYVVDPEGEFADYYGKSLSEDEMKSKVGKLIGDWERQKWWDSVLPAWAGSPQMSEGQKKAREAAKPGNR